MNPACVQLVSGLWLAYGWLEASMSKKYQKISEKAEYPFISEVQIPNIIYTALISYASARNFSSTDERQSAKSCNDKSNDTPSALQALATV